MTKIFIVKWTISDWDGEISRNDSAFSTEEKAQDRVNKMHKEYPNCSWEIDELEIDTEE